MGSAPGDYNRWVASSANYPQAELPLPGGEANGFFTCTSEAKDAPCDLHIQLRAGIHVEAMGNGRVPRADLTMLLAHVPLAALTAPGFADPKR
jgi:hypothetical protein